MPGRKVRRVENSLNGLKMALKSFLLSFYFPFFFFSSFYPPFTATSLPPQKKKKIDEKEALEFYFEFAARIDITLNFNNLS